MSTDSHPAAGNAAWRSSRGLARETLPAIADAATVVVLARIVFVSRPCRPM